MTTPTEKRIRDLLRHLDVLELRDPRPEDTAIVAVARQAIVDEISRLVRADGLAVYRRGDSLEAVSMVG